MAKRRSQFNWTRDGAQHVLEVPAIDAEYRIVCVPMTTGGENNVLTLSRPPYAGSVRPPRTLGEFGALKRAKDYAEEHATHDIARS